MTVDSGGMPWWFTVYLFVAFFAAFVSFVRWRVGVVDQLEAGKPMGAFGRGVLQLSVVYQEGEGRVVALNFTFPMRRGFRSLQQDHVVVVTPTQARLLAEYIRDAAAKGRPGLR